MEPAQFRAKHEQLIYKPSSSPVGRDDSPFYSSIKGKWAQTPLIYSHHGFLVTWPGHKEGL